MQPRHNFAKAEKERIVFYKDFSIWTISALSGTHHWMWNTMEGLWSWNIGLLAGFLALDPFSQGIIVAAWLGFGAWIVWKAKIRSLPGKTMTATLYPALLEGALAIDVIFLFYAAWVVLAFYAFLGVGAIAMFEIPIRAIF